MPSALVCHDIIDPVLQIFPNNGLPLQYLIVKIYALPDFFRDWLTRIQQSFEELDGKLFNLALEFGSRSNDKLVDFVAIILLYARLNLSLSIGIAHEHGLMLPYPTYKVCLGASCNPNVDLIII